MNWNERTLRLFLRLVGGASLLAIPCILLPDSWMDAVHRELGMGPLPEGPIVGYLTRSTSAFYGIFGGLLWLVSLDLPRHRRVLNYLGVASILLGVMVLAVDYQQGMPWWWCALEGPIDLTVGIAILILGNGWRSPTHLATTAPDHAGTVARMTPPRNNSGEACATQKSPRFS